MYNFIKNAGYIHLKRSKFLFKKKIDKMLSHMKLFLDI